MCSLSLKPGDSFGEQRNQMQALAKEIAGDLAALESGQDLLGDFVTELYLTFAEESRREDRRQKQAAGIAAAKAQGVRFGRPALPLPENFEECRRAWLDGRMSLRQAANACGMPLSTFQRAAQRGEKEDRAV